MYIYKGKLYNFVKNAKMKSPITRSWIDAVIYESNDTGETYVRAKSEFHKRFQDVNVVANTIITKNTPFHIETIAKLYPILKSELNVATGEIRKFNFVESCRGKTDIGKRVTSTERINNKDYGAIWVHVGNDYFKLIGLWPD